MISYSNNTTNNNTTNNSTSTPEFQQKIISFIGDARCGRSTLIGRFLEPDERSIQKHMLTDQSTRLDGYKCFAQRVWWGRSEHAKYLNVAVSHKLSWVKKFSISSSNENTLLTLLDVSSEKKKIDCLMRAIWLSNICVLVIDITPGVFEKDFNLQNGNIRTQLQMVAAVGLKNLVVCLAKCDELEEVVSNGKLYQRLEEIKTKLNDVLVQMSFNNVPFIPVSCKTDENVFSPSYLEFSHGSTLESTLKSIQLEPPRREWIEKPLLMAIFEIYKIGGIGTVVAGKIISGQLKEGQQVQFRDESTHLLKSIEIAHTSYPEAVCGQFCGINVKMASVREIKSHFFIYDQDYRERVKRGVESFKALIKIVNHPKNGIKVGYTFKLYYGVTNHCLCKIEDILHTVNPKTNQKLKVYPSILKKGDFAEVRLKPLITCKEKNCFLDTFENDQVMGRVVLMNGKQMIGAGKVLRIN